MPIQQVVVIRSEHRRWPEIISALGAMPDVRIIDTPARLGDAREIAVHHQPSVLITPDEVHGERAIPFLHALRRYVPITRFVVLCDDYHADELLLVSEASISGFLYWDGFLADPAAHVRVVIAGKAVVLSDAIATAHLAVERHRRPEGSPNLAFSAREIQVLRGLIEGMTHKAIANALGIGPRTVERTIEGLQEKLDAPNPYALVMKAAQLGLIP